MGALYDGNHYLVERFHNVLFTPESYGHIADAPIQGGDPPKALAMGLSKSYDGMPALPGVIPELDSVAHDPAVPDSHGPMQGKDSARRAVHTGRIEDRTRLRQRISRGSHRQPLRPDCRHGR